MTNAQRSYEVPFSLGAGGGVNLEARELRQLNRRQPDTASGRMNQHSLARLHVTETLERVVGREKNDRKCRGLLETQRGRLENDGPFVGHTVRSQRMVGN